MFHDLVGKPVWTWALFLLFAIGYLVCVPGVLRRTSNNSDTGAGLAQSATTQRSAHIRTAVVFVLVFSGVNVIAAELLGIENVPALLSLDVTATLLLGGIALSLWQTRYIVQTVSTDPALEHPKCP